jgi:enterobactin synthetase component D / holo-[acyl-carrier protein] synthase
VITSLLPACAVAYEEFSDIPGEPPFPGEESLIARAIEGRRSEFITARRCARRALGQLGYPPAPILSGPRREPVWPSGTAGSITHCRGYRAAAVARLGDLAALGIDAEPNGPLPDGVEEAVASERERKHFYRLSVEAPAVSWGRLLFSAKESVYKAWYPLTGRWLGFEDADLLIDRESHSFRARLLVDGRRNDGGPPLTEMTGRFAAGRGLVVTAVTVDR